MVKLICPHNEIHLVTKIFSLFFILLTMSMVRRSKKIKIASKFWYIYGSVTFFVRFFSFFAASLLRLCQSLHIGGRFRPSVPVSGPAVSGARILFLLPVCRWAGPLS